MAGDQEEVAKLPGMDNLTVARPSVTYAELTFSDGSVVPLERDDIVVLVGPNNAGKSAALRELDRLAPTSGNVIVSSKVAVNGTADDVEAYLRKHSLKTYPGGVLHFFRCAVCSKRKRDTAQLAGKSTVFPSCFLPTRDYREQNN